MKSVTSYQQVVCKSTIFLRYLNGRVKRACGSKAVMTNGEVSQICT